MKFRLPAGLKLWAPVAMVALLSPISTFLGNRYQVTAQDLVVPVILTLLTATAISAGFYRVWRRDQLGGYVAAVLVALVLSGEYDDRFDTVYQWIHGWLFLPKEPVGMVGVVGSLLMIGLTCIGAYWLGRVAAGAARRWVGKQRDVQIALLIMIVATFGFKAVPLAWDLAVEWPQFFYKPPHIAAQATAKPTMADSPDIYYIVLDRYASEDVLNQQFHFDNSDFLNFLKDRDYYVNPSAHNNYPYTTMSIASTMNADYLNDLVGRFGTSPRQTIVPFNETIRNSAIAQKLKSLGYSYDMIGNWYETSNKSDVADRVYQGTGRMTIMNADVILNNFSKNILTESPWWRFVQPGLGLGGFTAFSYANMGDVDMAHYQLQTLRQEAAKPAGGRFVFAHILVPHDPYNFNADGSVSANPGDDNNGKPIKQKYLGQVQFINSQMKDILSEIDRSGQGKSIVVLQADEGPYPMQLNHEQFDVDRVEGELRAGDMRKWTDADLQMKFGNLAAYHIPAVDWSKDAGAADSANVFRLVLNSYFGTSLPYLPDCYYAYADGRENPMTFVDITGRLSGKPADARCLADGRVKE
ncbi:MAG: hypothetical protein JWN01_549 [Patescibacteria group bacterium]|nr:hypothetical protein [Patescibacteria group bacterium]